jgi:hypothetical protein
MDRHHAREIIFRHPVEPKDPQPELSMSFESIASIAKPLLAS